MAGRTEIKLVIGTKKRYIKLISDQIHNNSHKSFLGDSNRRRPTEEEILRGCFFFVVHLH
jgi:hypothetical protein